MALTLMTSSECRLRMSTIKMYSSLCFHFNEYPLPRQLPRNYSVTILTDLLKDDASRTLLRGYTGNFFSKSSKFQLRSPHSVKAPGYAAPSDSKYRHQDSLQRIYEGPFDDRYLDPLTGRVKELVVQCTDKVYRGTKNSTYKRTFIRNVAPIMPRIANWPSDKFEEDKSKSSKHWARFLFLVRWPLTCYVLNHVVRYPSFITPLFIVFYKSLIQT